MLFSAGDIRQLRPEVEGGNVAPDPAVPENRPAVHGDQNHRAGPVRQTQEDLAGCQPGQEDTRRCGGQRQQGYHTLHFNKLKGPSLGNLK